MVSVKGYFRITKTWLLVCVDSDQLYSFEYISHDPYENLLFS